MISSPHCLHPSSYSSLYWLVLTAFDHHQVVCQLMLHQNSCSVCSLMKQLFVSMVDVSEQCLVIAAFPLLVFYFPLLALCFYHFAWYQQDHLCWHFCDDTIDSLMIVPWGVFSFHVRYLKIKDILHWIPWNFFNDVCPCILSKANTLSSLHQLSASDYCMRIWDEESICKCICLNSIQATFTESSLLCTTAVIATRCCVHQMLIVVVGGCILLLLNYCYILVLLSTANSFLHGKYRRWRHTRWRHISFSAFNRICNTC